MKNKNIESIIISSLIHYPTLIDKHIDKISIELFDTKNYQDILSIILKLNFENKFLDIEVIKNKIPKSIENDFIAILAKSPIKYIDDYLNILQDQLIKKDMKNIALEINKSLANNIDGVNLQSYILNKTEQITYKNKIEIFDIKNIAEIEDKEVKFICKSWLPIPRNTVSLISAPGGSGKSWLIMQLALRAVKENNIKKAFLWLSEDPKEISKHRYNLIKNNILNFDCKYDNRIDISDSPTIQFLYDDNRKVEVSALFPHFKVMLQDYDLIILDPLIAFYGTDENSNSNARRFMQLFTSWANKENKTIIFVHHSTKNTTQSRGASAFIDAVRTVYEIDNIKDADGKILKSPKKVIKLTKDNYGISNILKSNNVKRVLFPSQNEFQDLETNVVSSKKPETVYKPRDISSEF